MFIFFIYLLNIIILANFSIVLATFSSLTLILFYLDFKKIRIFDENPSIKSIISVILITIIFSHFLGFVVDKLELSLGNQEALVSMFTKSNFIILAFNTAFLIPILEEIVFRFSFFYNIKNKYLAFMFSCCIFTLLHLTNLDIKAFLVYFSLGFYFTYIYAYTKSLKLSILAHIINNLLSVMSIWSML